MYQGSKIFINLDKSLLKLSIQELIKRGIIKERVEAVCPQHGEYIAENPLIYILMGYVAYKECPTCSECRRQVMLAEQAEKEARQRYREAERFLRNLKYLGCGNDYISKRGNLDFNTPLLSKKLPNNETLQDYLRVENGDFKITSNLFILGSCGIGKTFFANMMADKALQNQKLYKIATAFELISIYSNSTQDGVLKINSAENLQTYLEDADGLIIDEIDFFLRENRTAREKEVLEIVTHTTSKNGIRTIVLGNCRAEELKVMDSKVLSRLTNGLLVNGWGFDDMRMKRG